MQSIRFISVLLQMETIFIIKLKCKDLVLLNV